MVSFQTTVTDNVNKTTVEVSKDGEPEFSIQGLIVFWTATVSHGLIKTHRKLQ